MMDVENVNGFENGLAIDKLGEGTTPEANGTVMQPSVSVDQRLKKKARRLTKQNSKESSPNGIVALPTPPRYFKNCRRSRGGYGRGLPKKGENAFFYLDFLYF
jgi:hypothetical protein